MILTRLRVLSCCALLVLAGAVVQKKREVAGLRKQTRYFSMAPLFPGPSGGVTKPHGERPEESVEEFFGAEAGDDDNELLAGMGAFMPNGDLSEEAIKILDLTDNEVPAVNEALSRFRAEAEVDLAKRLKPTVQHSEDDVLHQFYYARARRDRGQASFDGLTLTLGSIIGQDRSRRLMKAVTHDQLSARLCKLDLEVEVIQPADEGGEVKVSYQLRSPKNGEATQTHDGCSLAEFEEKFGKLFEGQGGGE